MSKNKNLKFMRVLMLTALLCLPSCKTASCELCPVYPVAGPEVAAELKDFKPAPNFWEWLGRIDKLRRELELCR